MPSSGYLLFTAGKYFILFIFIKISISFPSSILVVFHSLTFCSVTTIYKCVYMYIFFFIIQHVKAYAIPCPHQPPTRGDNTVLVAQGWVLPLLALPRSFCYQTGYLKELYIYIYIYTPDQLRAEITLDVLLHL